MENEAARRFVTMHKAVGGTRDWAGYAKRGQKPLRERRLASAHIAVKRYAIGRAGKRRKPARQSLHRLGSFDIPHCPSY
jgi:hypothetical protein